MRVRTCEVTRVSPDRRETAQMHSAAPRARQAHGLPYGTKQCVRFPLRWRVIAHAHKRQLPRGPCARAAPRRETVRLHTALCRRDETARMHTLCAMQHACPPLFSVTGKRARFLLPRGAARTERAPPSGRRLGACARTPPTRLSARALSESVRLRTPLSPGQQPRACALLTLAAARLGACAALSLPVGSAPRQFVSPGKKEKEKKTTTEKTKLSGTAAPSHLPQQRKMNEGKAVPSSSQERIEQPACSSTEKLQ